MARRRPTRQPVRVAPAAQFGQRQTAEQLQAGAPLPVAQAVTGAPASSPAPGSQPGGAPAASPPPRAANLFRPTERPGEPLTAGAATGPGATPPRLPLNGVELLTAIARRFPHPDLHRLIAYAASTQLNQLPAPEPRTGANPILPSGAGGGMGPPPPAPLPPVPTPASPADLTVDAARAAPTLPLPPTPPPQPSAPPATS